MKEEEESEGYPKIHKFLAHSFSASMMLHLNGMTEKCVKEEIESSSAFMQLVLKKASSVLLADNAAVLLTSLFYFWPQSVCESYKISESSRIISAGSFNERYACLL